MAGTKLGNLLLLDRAPEAPVVAVRRFQVWVGSDIPSDISDVPGLCQRALSLVPDGTSWDDVEVLLKAGEGGSWQAHYLHPRWGDPHPLAIDGPSKLMRLRTEAQWDGVSITPYVVIRRSGNVRGEDWTTEEQSQIRQCYDAAGRVVLNVEPGSQYDGGPKRPDAIGEYMVGTRVPKAAMEVCSIPRKTQVDELGGDECMYAWTSSAGSASWECYGIATHTLVTDVAIPRIDANHWAPPGPQYRIPICNRDEREVWAGTIWAAPGLGIWHIEGN